MLGLSHNRGILPNNAEHFVQLSHFTQLCLEGPIYTNVIYDLQSMITFI